MPLQPVLFPAEPAPSLTGHFPLFANESIKDFVGRLEADADVGRAAAALRHFILANHKEAANSAKEETLEDIWIRPILCQLGWEDCYDTRASVTVREPGYRGKTETDMSLFLSKEACSHARNFKKTGDLESYWAEAAAVVEAKRWDRPLDDGLEPAKHGKELKKGRDAGNEVPMLQIARYIQSSHQNMRWGMVTNGRLWRLVHRDTARSYNTYHEADLMRLVQMPEPESLAALRVFVALFRRTAFVRAADGLMPLDHLLRGSNQERADIEENLKERFRQALEELINGLVEWESNGIKRGDNLATVTEAAMIFLYRLLFILNAEDRGILPIEKEAYRTRFGFQRIYNLVRQAGAGELKSESTHWDKLANLFKMIDKGANEEGTLGKEPFVIFAYNGGLFGSGSAGSPNALLDQWKVSNPRLDRVLNQICMRPKNPRSKKDHTLVEVRYRDLGVEHLGSIYEGLLEQQARWVEGAQASVEVVNEKGERKITGSYYTPSYIVQYIAEKTLGPLYERAKEKIRMRLAEIAGIHPANAAQEKSLAREQDTLQGALDDEVLQLRVLDPAMGSGHFLVGAINYLARRLFEDSDHESGDEAWAYHRDMNKDGSRLAFWKRMVVEHCIYGVDKNPMAVELAKLSLWLHTVQREKALSFLDHHIRCGDSLVGADLDRMGVIPRKEKKSANAPDNSLFGYTPKGDLLSRIRGAVSHYVKILEMPSESDRQVHEKETLLIAARAQLDMAREVANVWTLTAHGALEENGFIWDDYLHSPGAEKWQKAAWFGQAQAAGKKGRWFHWWVEFPDAFFDAAGKPREDAGFDAVIGNPPYVRQEVLGPTFKKFAALRYKVYAGTADLYSYFIERGLALLSPTGRFSYIVANKWMRANYGRALREWLAGQSIEEILDFGDLPVFGKVVTYPCILTLNREPRSEAFHALTVPALPPEGTALESHFNGMGHPVRYKDLKAEGWSLADQRTAALLEKIRKAGTPLGEYVDGKIYRGVTTGFNDAFLINAETRRQLVSEDKACAKIIKPFLKGEDIKRYGSLSNGWYLLFTRRGIDIEKYPSVKKHLVQFRKQLEPKPDRWDESRDGHWPGRKPGDYQWYEIQDSTAYWKMFEKPKIVLPDISVRANFGVDANLKAFCVNTAYIIPTLDLYLLGVLNSGLITFYYRCISSTIRGGYLRFIQQYLEMLPIRAIDPKSKRDKARHEKMVGWVEKMLELHRQLADAPAVQKAKLDQQIAELDRQIDALVYELYGLTGEEIAIVEGRR